jgi:hypothetical protein
LHIARQSITVDVFIAGGNLIVVFIADGYLIVVFIAGGNLIVVFIAGGNLIVVFIAGGNLIVVFISGGNLTVVFITGGTLIVVFITGGNLGDGGTTAAWASSASKETAQGTNSHIPLSRRFRYWRRTAKDRIFLVYNFLKSWKTHPAQELLAMSMDCSSRFLWRNHKVYIFNLLTGLIFCFIYSFFKCTVRYLCIYFLFSVIYGKKEGNIVGAVKNTMRYRRECDFVGSGPVLPATPPDAGTPWEGVGPSQADDGEEGGGAHQKSGEEDVGTHENQVIKLLYVHQLNKIV